MPPALFKQLIVGGASDANGELNFSNLPLGSYAVSVSSNGFNTAKYDKVQITAGSTYTNFSEARYLFGRTDDRRPKAP